MRALLDAHDIEWYETSAGNWGLAMPGIWVKQNEQVDQATRLIEDYEQQRARDMRDSYERMLDSGQQPTFFESFMQRPLRSAGIVMFCMFIVYVMVKPFIQMAQQ